MRSSPWAFNRRALPCGFKTAAGERCHRYPVRAYWSGVDHSFWESHVTDVVIARSPAEAAAHWLDFWSARVQYPVEVEAVGPKGGITHRYRGWEATIGAALLEGLPTHQQVEFRFVVELGPRPRPQRRGANTGAGNWWRNVVK